MLWVTTILIVAGAMVATPHIAAVATGFFAKQLCSGVFISGRSPAAVADADLHRYPPWPIMSFASWRVYKDERAVAVDWFGLAPRVARFAPDSGCTLVMRLPGAVAPTRGLRPAAATGSLATDALWPEGDRVALSETPALERIVAGAFDSADADTRAVVVVHRGRIVAERYAEGFTAHTALPGWSMAKSVVNALAGVMVRDGLIALDTPLAQLAPQALAEWRDDLRRSITVGQALTMTTGLAFDESYVNPFSDAMRMLFTSGDAVQVARSRSLSHSPGSHWAYSSGTTNLLMRALLQAAPEARRARLVEETVFTRIGMYSAVLERDAAGTPIGSSFMYASARDWARFGWLYANDGVWAGERVLPEGWVAYSRAPVPESIGQYGAHFWIKDDSTDHPAALPADSFHATGHAMQRITIIPSRELVVVRLGLSFRGRYWDQPRFVANVLDVLDFKPSAAAGRGENIRRGQ